MLPAQIRQYPYGNTNAGGSEGPADEQRHQKVKPENPVSQPISRDQRKEKAGKRDQQGVTAGIEQATHIGLETHTEQQEDDTDLGHA